MKLTYIESESNNPYKNLALEEWLLNSLEDDEVILYLWQNAHTVVIGRNQNAWKECNISTLEADGGHLARRLSGGGAVYHDLGNMNFTFLAKKPFYDVSKQTDVVLKALKNLGFDAEKSGRNDLLADGKKVSGNAFYEHDGRCYQHGTLLVDVDKDKMASYLNVAPDKLKGKGVSSVKARVGNLAQMDPTLTIDALKSALKNAFADVYDGPLEVRSLSSVPAKEWDAMTERYGSWSWRCGRKFRFDRTLGNRFSWGRVDIELQIDAGLVSDAQIYSDALVPDMIDALAPALLGARYENGELAKRIENVKVSDEVQEGYLKELTIWLQSAEC